jgi:pyruvate kinase
MMRVAAGIITEDDNPQGHASVIGLKLNIPVIIGFKNATNLLREGAIITVDAPKGLVYSGGIPNPGNQAAPTGLLIS